jgi:hypothetical protein
VKPSTVKIPSLIAALAALTLACTPSPDPARPAQPPHPVLLIGLDGLEWDTVLPLLALLRAWYVASPKDVARASSAGGVGTRRWLRRKNPAARRGWHGGWA